MEEQYDKEQWKYMEEMCILVDDQDNQIGSDSKKNCKYIEFLSFRSHNCSGRITQVPSCF